MLLIVVVFLYATISSFMFFLHYWHIVLFTQNIACHDNEPYQSSLSEFSYALLVLHICYFALCMFMKWLCCQKSST